MLCFMQAKAKSEGLWNLFVPLETDRTVRYGKGLTNLEYAFICEEMGKCPISPEVSKNSYACLFCIELVL